MGGGSHEPGVRAHPLASPALSTFLGPGAVAVVIDLLRASTTIVAALASGARSVRPVVDVDGARAMAGPASLLGGERGGLPPEGFDLGNSPVEYTGARVGGREIVFTTTNGTRAIETAHDAGTILIGALMNLTSTAEYAARRVAADAEIHLVCAGTGGEVTEEDVLCAGAFVGALDAFGIAPRGDEAHEALRHWRAATDEPDALLRALRASRGGLNLIGIGLDRDIEDAARIDEAPVVALFDRIDGEIRIA